MIVSKHELFDRVGEKWQAMGIIQEIRNSERGSLCFSDPPEFCLDRVCSGVRLMDLALRQPPPDILRSGTGLKVQQMVFWITLR